jgi:hypothetical protein
MSVLFSNNNENVTENDKKCKIIHIHFLFFLRMENTGKFLS